MILAYPKFSDSRTADTVALVKDKLAVKNQQRILVCDYVSWPRNSCARRMRRQAAWGDTWRGGSLKFNRRKAATQVMVYTERKILVSRSLSGIRESPLK